MKLYELTDEQLRGNYLDSKKRIEDLEWSLSQTDPADPDTHISIDAQIQSENILLVDIAVEVTERLFDIR